MSGKRGERAFLDLLRVLEERPEWKERLRQILLSEELFRLPERFERFLKHHEEVMAEIRAIKEDIRRIQEENERIGQEIQAIKEDIRRIQEENERIWQEIRAIKEENNRIWQEIRAMRERQDSMAQTLNQLAAWRQGEEGRRRGERYERKMLRNLPVLFAGGEGGPPDRPDVYARLRAWLGDRIADLIQKEEANVFLTDAVWWKGERVAVVEVSWRVNGRDVERAFHRARVLQQVGVDARGVVVGETWVGNAQEKARDLGVEWYVDGEFSPGLVRLRKAS